jgi:hypothetical protein
MKRNYSCLISAGTLILAEELARLEDDEKRKQKKENVVERKRVMFREAFPKQTARLSLEGDAAKLLVGKWKNEDAVTFIIDLSFTNPFAPYELNFEQGDFRAALRTICPEVGLDTVVVDRILTTRKSALKAHKHMDWSKVGRWGIGGVAILGTGGWLAAPLIGTAIGAAAGLSGAASTAHGLAILGGGSLALGGAGMAGGMWAVTGMGRALGLMGARAGTTLLQLGAASARAELVKLQVGYREVTLAGQSQVRKAQEVIKSLLQQKEEIEKRLQDERELNEKNSARIKDIEMTLRALENSTQWMQKESA